MSLQLHRHWLQAGSGTKPLGWSDHFYVGEVDRQCEFALRAFGEMQHAYGQDPRHPSLLALAHTLLVFAGNVAKIVTASKDSSSQTRARAKRIRKLLDIEHLDFSQIRKARNYFEHFDERMDRYLGNHKGMLVTSLVLDHAPTTIQLDDGREYSPSYLQFLNTTTLELTLYNEIFTLSSIVKQIQNIQTAARSWLTQLTAQT